MISCTFGLAQSNYIKRLLLYHLKSFLCTIEGEGGLKGYPLEISIREPLLIVLLRSFRIKPLIKQCIGDKHFLNGPNLCRHFLEVCKVEFWNFLSFHLKNIQAKLNIISGKYFKFCLYLVLFSWPKKYASKIIGKI